MKRHGLLTESVVDLGLSLLPQWGIKNCEKMQKARWYRDMWTERGAEKGTQRIIQKIHVIYKMVTTTRPLNIVEKFLFGGHLCACWTPLEIQGLRFRH